MTRNTWTKLPASSDEISRVNGALLHVAGSRGNWLFAVTLPGLITVSTGNADTKSGAKRSAEKAALAC